MAAPPDPRSRPPGRVADAHLRGAAGPVPARIYWPGPTGDGGRPPLLVLLHPADDRDRGPLCRRLGADLGAVVLAVAIGGTRPDDDAVRVTAWAVDHADELGADGDLLVVGGDGPGCDAAVSVADQADRDGWPPITQLLLLRPPAPASEPERRR